MQGERGSVFKSIFLNPIVWAGVVLTLLTLKNKAEDDALSIFFSPVMYRNLALGCALYVGLFDRHYTKDRCRLDIKETLLAVVNVMLTVLWVWFLSLNFIVYYHRGGENYKELLTTRYQQIRALKQEINESGGSAAVINAVKEIGRDEDKSYIVTPDGNGGFRVEVIEK